MEKNIHTATNVYILELIQKIINDVLFADKSTPHLQQISKSYAGQWPVSFLDEGVYRRNIIPSTALASQALYERPFR